MATVNPTARSRSSHQAWYRPTLSPEHGVYVVLFVAFLVGVAAAQTWTWATTMAFVAAFAGFQAEHPLVLQIKQRKSWKPRFLFWGGVYGGLALGLAGVIYWQQGLGLSPLLGIYGAAGLALGLDAIAVRYREQKSIFNELITFAAVCLAAPFAYGATTGTLTAGVIGLWMLCTLYFACTIFTVKLRKQHQENALTAALYRAGAYHAIAALIILLVYGIGWLSLVPALALIVGLGKFALIIARLDWYRSTSIGSVATLETSAALVFGSIVAISLLPPHL
jgi:hypothetical protein